MPVTRYAPGQQIHYIGAPVRSVGARALGADVGLQDSFAGVNGTLLTAHTPNVGGPWLATALGTLTRPMEINSNAATIDVGIYLDGYQVGEHLIADATLTANAKYPSTVVSGFRWAGFLVRYTDANNFWRLIIYDSGGGTSVLQIAEWVGGVATQRAAANQVGYVPNPANVYAMSVILSGTNISFTFDGRTVSYGAAASGLAATKHGMYLFGTGGYIDNYSGVP